MAQQARHDALRDAALAKAHRELAAGVALAQQDPRRPRCHFRPPCHWMNDPNGTCYQDGKYHVFYQLNPSGESWGNMHWGHATSSDGVFWHHEPVALWPSLENPHDSTDRGRETHCFSGSIFNGSVFSDGGRVGTHCNKPSTLQFPRERQLQSRHYHSRPDRGQLQNVCLNLLLMHALTINVGEHADRPKAIYTKVNTAEDYKPGGRHELWLATAEDRAMRRCEQRNNFQRFFSLIHLNMARGGYHYISHPVVCC
jgi:hypothetical protein